MEKILIPSNQGAIINLDKIPRLDKSSLEDFIFGDDLELIFTADKNYHKKIMKLSDNSGINISLLGQTKKNGGIKYLLNKDEVLFPRKKGWNHGKK